MLEITDLLSTVHGGKDKTTDSAIVNPLGANAGATSNGGLNVDPGFLQGVRCSPGPALTDAQGRQARSWLCGEVIGSKLPMPAGAVGMPGTK